MEQFWEKKLHPLTPRILNGRVNSPSIPIIIIYSDTTGKIVQIVLKVYPKCLLR
jgi:hypothetical protein